MRLLIYIIIVIASLGLAQAEVIGLNVEYEHDGVKLRGYLAYDVALNTIRPGVLVIHEWWGLNDYAKEQAHRIAEMGYIAFACDMYGADIVTDSSDTASKLSKPFREDRELMRERAAVGLWNLKNFSLCDKTRLLAVGYSFGGTCALELARSGADLKGVVSFYGGLNTPNPQDAKNIKANLLICHGADDEFVDEAEIAGFIQEMRGAGVDWQMIHYGGAVHAFTNPTAGDDPSAGVAYDEKGDKRSWEAMKTFFREALINKSEEERER